MQTSQNYLQAKDYFIIGYFPLRGKAQVCRLLCEYLELPYKDLLFNAKSWEDFKATQNLNWTFAEIPFLKDKDTVVTETYPICLYILHKANRMDLLGQNLAEQAKSDTILCKAQPIPYLTTLLINRREITLEVREEVIGKLWSKYMQPKLTEMEREATDIFYFPNLSLVDFYLYEMIYYLRIICPDKLCKYPKLMQIYNRVALIPQIANYEASKKCIREVCPIKYQS